MKTFCIAPINKLNLLGDVLNPIDPSTFDAADTEVVNPPGFVPNVVDMDPDPADVRDLNEDADA